jgi:hypothetical protein
MDVLHSHRLILKGDQSNREWLLEWDDKSFVLKDPDGLPVFEAESQYAHRIIELHEMYADGRISFATPNGSLAFKKNPEALVELREFAEARLSCDDVYRSELRRSALRAIPCGLSMFIVAGGLFSLYCWYVSWAPDPPPGHWIRWFGWLIHGVLLLLLGVALAGPAVCYSGFRHWLRIRRIDRKVAASEFDGNAD